MTAAPIRLLLLEDNPGDARLVQVALAHHAPGAFDITLVERLADALARIGDERFDAILCDLGLPDSAGVATAQAIAARAPALPLVVLTGSDDEDLGREAIEHGAQDYLVKGEANGALIARTLRYAIERKRLEIGLRTANEVLERRVAERTLALSRSKDLYSALSQTNQTIVRITARAELFAAICRIAVERARFRFAWIGLFDAGDQQVKPVAQYGEDAGYVNQVHVSTDRADAAGRGPTGQAFRSGQHVVSNDFLNDPATAPWHQAGQRSGLRASAAFPFRQGGTVTGVFNVYAGQDGFFTEDVIATLDEMAVDISFALDNLAREAERRQAGENLRESEQKYRGIYDNLQDVYIESDIGGNIVEVSPQIEVLSRGQYTRDDVLGKSTDMFHGDPARRDAFNLALREHGTVKDFEATLTNRDGSTVVCSISAMIQRGADGTLSRVCATVRDITERISAQDALRAAEERFRGLVEQAIAAIYVIQDDKLVYVNPRYAEIFGYDSAEELIGRHPLLVVAEKDREGNAEHMRQRIAGEVATVSYQFTGRRKDGSTIEVGVHGARATHNGRPAVIGMMQDISEKKRSEEKIQQYVAQLEVAFMQTVGVATALSELRDPYTAGHERRVGELAVAIGADLGFDARRQEGLKVAGYLHDIGKIMIPSEILSKPGKLSSSEFELIKGHPQASYDVLKTVEFPWPVAEAALQHHERIDGSGYPQGLKGEQILLESRILAVADVVEAMSSHRPYRAGFGIDASLAQIRKEAGTKLDAKVVDACERVFREQGFSFAKA